MAIYDHQYGELPYYRVFRAWGGKEYQEYVRIKGSKKAAYAKAKKIDERMAKEQEQFYKEQALTPGYHVRKDGSIRGLRRITVTRKGRNPAEVFELRINVPWEEGIKRTTLSVSVHGDEKAFKMAIDRICEWYGLSADSLARQAMLSSYAFYTKSSNDNSNVAEVAIKRARDEIASIRGGLVKTLKRFTA